MAKHLQREIENLKKKLLALGAKVETVVRDAALAIEKRDSDLELRIQDNGQGFNAEDDPRPGGEDEPGMGLSSMQERAELTGGSLEIRTEPGKGTTVRATWPLATP